MPPLRGIIHAAGIIDDAVLIRADAVGGLWYANDGNGEGIGRVGAPYCSQLHTSGRMPGKLAALY